MIIGIHDLIKPSRITYKIKRKPGRDAFIQKNMLVLVSKKYGILEAFDWLPSFGFDNVGE